MSGSSERKARQFFELSHIFSHRLRSLTWPPSQQIWSRPSRAHQALSQLISIESLSSLVSLVLLVVKDEGDERLGLKLNWGRKARDCHIFRGISKKRRQNLGKWRICCEYGRSQTGKMEKCTVSVSQLAGNLEKSNRAGAKGEFIE